MIIDYPKMKKRIFFMIKPEGLKIREKILNMILKKAKIAKCRRYSYAPLDKIAKLYEEHKDKKFYPWLFEYYEGKSLEVMILEEREDIEYKEDFYTDIIELVGDTDPEKAKKGTIRSLSNDSMERSIKEKRMLKNLVHRSKDPNESLREISIFFNSYN